MNKNIIDPKTYKPNIDIIPRIIDILPQEAAKAREPWDFNQSVFAKFTQNSDKLLKRCFEFDFKCCVAFDKIIKTEIERVRVKEVLRKYYREMLDCYRYWSGYAPARLKFDIWSISINAFQLLAVESEMYNDNFQVADVGINLVAVNSKGIKSKYIPPNGLVRYQLMEIFVRCSKDKYISSGQCEDWDKAVQKMMDHMSPYFKHEKFDAQLWRETHYWNEGCDILYNEKYGYHFNLIVKDLYKKYSGSKSGVSEGAFMCNQEFKQMNSDAGLFTDNYTERHAEQATVMCQQTIVDEIIKAPKCEEIFKIRLIEFYEILARIAEEISLPQVGYEQLTKEQRIQQPICFKLEALLIHFCKKLCNPKIQKKFEDFHNSVFDEYYDPNSTYKNQIKN